MADPAAREPFCANPQCILHRVQCGERVLRSRVESQDSIAYIDVTRQPYIIRTAGQGVLRYKLCDYCRPNSVAIGQALLQHRHEERTAALHAHEERIRNSPGNIISQVIAERRVQLAASRGILPNFYTNAGPITEAELMGQQGTPVSQFFAARVEAVSQEVGLAAEDYVISSDGNHVDQYARIGRGHDMEPKSRARRKIYRQLTEKGFPPEKIQKFIASLKLD